MNLWKLQPSKVGLMLVTTIAVTGSLFCLAVPQASAQAILQREGTLEPAQREHTFSGTAGQAVLIQVDSAQFDTALTLIAPDGEEIGSYDGFNYSSDPQSGLVATLPSNGVYRVVARSMSGNGGSYTVTVKVATPYEQAYARATTLMQEGKYTEAVAAYNEAIRLDPNQPIAYQNLANALYSEAQLLQPAERQAIVGAYQRALDLYERAGDTEAAQMLRDQIMYLQPEQP